MNPLNIKIMDVSTFIKDKGLMEVTSPMIHSSSSSDYDPNGLFSESIFGPIASEQRMLRHGFIKLHCRVLHPIIYENLQSIKRFYTEIMAGKSYAVWDKTEKDFFRASEMDEGADTGYSFFLKHYNEINFKKNLSLKRNDKINVIAKFKSISLIKECIVIPAGIRDMKEDEGRIEKDSINSLYTSLLNSCRAMPEFGDLDPIYDTVHYSIQKKVVEIYVKLTSIIEGKRGFLQGKLAYRHIAGGTRNVITATNLESTDPESPQAHKSDEIMIPLFQAAKGYASLVVYRIRELFYSTIISQSSEAVALINPNGNTLEYVPIDDKDKDSLLSEEGIQKTIDRFHDENFRFKPVSVRSGGKPYYLYLVYDTGKKIYIFRNLSEFKADMAERFDISKVRPLTYVEMLYIATYFASKGKYGTCTRYPVTDQQSIFVSKTHLMSTAPARVVDLVMNIGTEEAIQLPEYPIFGKKLDDVMKFHPSKRAGLNADYDGNCLTGETTVRIRFTRDWLDKLNHEDFSESEQNFLTVWVDLLDGHTKHTIDGVSYYYNEVRLDSLPQPGQFMIDRNGARVYTIPDGCEVLSFYRGKECYQKFEKITVEKDCDITTIYVDGRKARVSTNPSVAVFDTLNGKLKKVEPMDAYNKFAPIVIKDMTPYGNFGTFDDGWLLGTMIIGDRIPSEVAENVKRVSSYSDMEERFSVQAKNKLELINKCFIECGTRDFIIGMLCGIMDALKGVRKNIHGDIELYMHNIDDIQTRKLHSILSLICFKLGIMYHTITCGFVLRYVDVYNIRNDLRFSLEENTQLLNELLEGDKPTYDDRIPVSFDEHKAIVKAIEPSDPDTAKCISLICIHGGFPRRLLLNYIDKFDNLPALKQRILNTNVVWSQVSVDSSKSKETVYDLLVPESKVFAVNNGLIVYDTVSWIPIYSDEANKQCEEYVNSIPNYVLPSGLSQIGLDDLCGITIRSLTTEPPIKSYSK